MVSFRVKGSGLDTSWGQGGLVAIQSEGTGRPTAEDRGRNALTLPEDRTLQVGRYGGIPAAFVLDASGQLDAGVSDDGILELPNDAVDAQFFGAALSADGKQPGADDQQPRGRRAAGAARRSSSRRVAPKRERRRVDTRATR